MSKEKEKRKCSKWETDCCSMWSSNIKTIVEKHVLSENVHLHSAGRWSWWSSYVPTISKETSLNKPTSKQKLLKKSFHSSIQAESHCNGQKTSRSNTVFSRKSKWIISQWIICLKMFITQWRKNRVEMR